MKIYGASGSAGGAGRSEGAKDRGGRIECASGRAGSSSGRGSKGKPAKPKGFKECQEKMLRLLAMRDFSERGMQARLVKAGFVEADAAKAVSQAKKAHLISDARYAEGFISSRKDMGWGRARIVRDLAKNGIDCDGEVASSIIDESFDDEEEVRRATACLAKHRTTAKNPREAHYRFLVSRGYSPSVCRKAVELAAGLGWSEE